MIRRLLSITAAAFLAVACTPSSQTDSTGSTGAESTSAMATNAVEIVTSTQVWADIAEKVAPDAHITPIITGQDSDPHSFEPAAADLAKAKEADIVVVGGGGYDAWLYKAVDEEKIVHALPLVDGHDHAAEHSHEDHEHADHDHAANEHVWFDVHAVTDLATELAAKIKQADPDAKTTPEEVEKSLEKVHDTVHALPKVKVAQTHPIADLLVAHSELEDVTPEGYHHSALEEAEPSAADVAAFLDELKKGEIKVLIDAPQTATDTTRRLRAAAEEAGIKVVDVYELPAKGENYFDYFTDFATRLAAATK
ncbi:ABC transporter substrate-binding protein [Corynebacterium canis]|uniref:ABC transporter substrate-binding protein n=1 Tax=Corynebacterium canis TaxID=679663 RepID=A0A5C5UHF7_9CORY|nr:zinc ABC transporter substrate-binding protein [Corynebacterium canis]TWT25526.1 ABC transporter substrate-binding protein [Corynebacterium canis]WJY76215.1 Manganese ABC transporter substrate-binding lipoprotein precursor [Corynebacterium canis]